MRSHTTTPFRVTLAALLAASLLSPVVASADDGRNTNHPPARPAPAAQAARAEDQRARAEQARQEQARQEQAGQQARAAQARAAQEHASREKAAREEAAQAAHQRSVGNHPDERDHAANRARENEKTEVAGIQVAAAARHQDAEVRKADEEPKTAARHDDHKVGVCHATGSASNPFVFIVVSREGAINGHEQHGDDIIGVASAQECPKAAQAAQAGASSEVAGARVENAEVRDHPHPLWAQLRERLHNLAALFGAKHKH